VEGVDEVEGLVGMDVVCEEAFLEAWRRIPRWTEHETLEGKKAGYPLVVKALEELQGKLQSVYGFGNAAVYLDTLVRTLEVMSPEIYEYYRRVMEMFRVEVRRGCRQLAELEVRKGEAFGCYGLAGEGRPEMDVFRDAIRKGCKLGVILTEKYRVYL
jgi:hypothetical protein